MSVTLIKHFHESAHYLTGHPEARRASRACCQLDSTKSLEIDRRFSSGARRFREHRPEVVGKLTFSPSVLVGTASLFPFDAYLARTAGWHFSRRPSFENAPLFHDSMETFLA